MKRKPYTVARKNGKIFGIFGSASGVSSVISAHNVCHMVCLAVVSFLSLFGILVSSDVLMWLQNYNILFWEIGIVFLGMSLLLLVRYRECISRRIIMFNTGLLIAGFPFVRATDLIIVGS